MYKILFLLHLWVVASFGTTLQSVEAHYDISYAVFGKIGQAKALFNIDKNQYTIRMVATATGIAKLMSHARIEVYESQGIISDNQLIPLHFSASIKKGENPAIVNQYNFDYKQKKIFHTEVAGGGKNAKISKDETLHFFAHNDILTLFFNLKSYLQKNNCIDKGCRFRAIGANEKDGQVDIYHVDLEKNMLSVILNRKIFASKQGKIDIHLTAKGLCSDAILKDVIFFGDVKAKATKIIYK